MKKYVVFLVLGVFLLSAIEYANAWECGYGEAKAWVKLPDDSEWREALVDGVTLKIHEPFKVKAQITTKTKVHVLDIEIYDPGVTKVFEVIEGPSKNGESILKYDVPANWSKTYEWTVRPTGKWTEGWAPLNFGAVFMKTQDDYNGIDKTIIHAYISPEEWNGSSENNQNEDKSHHTMGFEFVTLSLVIMLYIWRKRNG